MWAWFGNYGVNIGREKYVLLSVSLNEYRSIKTIQNGDFPHQGKRLKIGLMFKTSEPN